MPSWITTTHTSTSTHTGPAKGFDQDMNVMICSTQDIWSLITSMQTVKMKQSEEIKTLALKNQELEHRLQLQDMKALQHEKQIQELQEAFNQQTTKTQDTRSIVRPGRGQNGSRTTVILRCPQRTTGIPKGDVAVDHLR